MAELVIEGNNLVLRLSLAEKLESVHGDISVPLRAVSGVEVLEDADQPADMIGIKLGTHLPGVIEVASVRGLKKKIFAAVHHSTPRGLRISLEDADYDEWVVGLADPEAKAARIKRALPPQAS